MADNHAIIDADATDALAVPAATSASTASEDGPPAATKRRGPAEWVVGLSLAVGIGLRFVHYLSGRPLWLDEAALARNILSRSPLELLGVLDYSQAAPLGFLLLTKGSVGLFGPSDMALRLVPLITSLAALGMFVWMARRILSTFAAPIAVAMFAVAYPLVYYAAELKPYSVDVLAVIGLTALGFWGSLDNRRGLTASVVGGAVAPWFAFASVFALPVAGSMLIARSRRLGPLALLGGAWGGSLLALYVFNIMPARTEGMLRYWDFVYPSSYGLSDVVSWLATVLSRIPRFLVLPTVITMGVAAFGAVHMLRQGRRLVLAALLAPVLFAFALSFFRIYPMTGRLALFAMPATVMLIAEAIGTGPKIAAVGGAFLVSAALLPTAANTPPQRAEILSVLEAISSRVQPDETLYVFGGAIHAASIYAPRLGLDFQPGIQAWGAPQEYIAEVDTLSAPRFWFIYTHPHKHEIELVMTHLDTIRAREDAIIDTGAGAILYVRIDD